MRILQSILIAFAAASFTQKVAALFDDQAGSYDWYKQHIGLVSSATFPSTKPRVCVVTEQIVVGCLNLRDGSVAWRKLLSGDGSANSIQLVTTQSHLLITVVSGYLRAFDLDGNLKWQRKLDSSGDVILEVAAGALGLSTESVLLLQNGESEILDSSDGSTVSKRQRLPPLPNGGLRAAVTKDNDVYVVSFQPGSTQATVVVAHSSGTEQPGVEHSVEFPVSLSAVYASAAGSFAVLSADGAAVCILPLSGGTPSQGVACQPLAELFAELPGTGAYRLAGTSSGYLLSSSDPGRPGAALLTWGQDGSLRALKHFPNVVAVTPETRMDDGGAVGLLEKDTAGGMRLLVVSPSSGDVLQDESYPAIPVGEHVVGQAPAAVPTGVVLGAFRKKDKTTGFRALVSLSSGVTVMLQQGTVVWSRDESLATIKETLFADLPAKAGNGTALESHASRKIDLQTRLRYQILGAKVQLKLSTPAEAAELHQLRSLLSDKNTPVRDVNGFRKLLLALTATGKVAALHNGDGRVLWSRSFAPDSAPSRLLPWRSYHDIQHPPEVLLLRENGPGAYAAVLNAHTGEELWRQPLSYSVRRVVPLHPPVQEGPAVQSMYLLVQTDGGEGEAAPIVHLLPDTAAVRGHLASGQRALYLVSQGGGDDGGSLHGYRLTLQGGGGPEFGAMKAWQLALPDSILATATRDPSEPIQSSVKVLSDRTIKYKYLNPNLLFVATGLPNGAALDAAGGGGGDSLSSEVTVHLIDTVTGRVLHRQSHAGARGPVTAVMAEHAVLYFFRDIDSGRFVACSMELYDATVGREFSVLDYLFNPNSTKPVSSFQATPVEVQTQSFFSRVVPTAAAVTRTEQGITAKQLLLVLNTDQVYALDRRWVDPRRPKKQKLSQDEMEEGLVPYQDTLPLSPMSFATLDKQVLGIRGVKVDATRLESTCLLFVHGIDIFFTRLAPAKGFDSLEDDFNYALLLAALVGLVTGAVILQYMAKQTSLNQKWK